jgi:hypothetical protein
VAGVAALDVTPVAGTGGVGTRDGGDGERNDEHDE